MKGQVTLNVYMLIYKEMSPVAKSASARWPGQCRDDGLHAVVLAVIQQ